MSTSITQRLREDADWWDKWGKGAKNGKAIAEVSPTFLRAAADEIDRLRDALMEARCVKPSVESRQSFIDAVLAK